MTAEPRPGSGTPDADDGHTINVGPVTVADPGSGTPDPTPNGQTWVCRNGRPTARCVEDCPVAAGCGPVPPAPSSDTPSDERLCGHCAASNDPSPAHRYIVGRVARQCPGRPAPAAASSPDEGASEDRCARDACPVWDGGDCGGCYLTPRPASADEGTRQRPGGWVDGIGWVARLGDVADDDLVRHGEPTSDPARDARRWYTPTVLVEVARWADGSTPQPPVPPQGTERPDTAALLTIGDWLLRTLPGHQGAEQTAAALAYTARWIDAQPPVPPSPAPRVDRADLIERLYDANGFDDIKYHEAEVRGLLTEAADALDARAPSGPCPYIVTGGEGTSHCSLAERSAMHAATPPSTPAEPEQADG